MKEPVQGNVTVQDLAPEAVRVNAENSTTTAHMLEVNAMALLTKWLI